MFNTSNAGMEGTQFICIKEKQSFSSNAFCLSFLLSECLEYLYDAYHIYLQGMGTLSREAAL